VGATVTTNAGSSLVNRSLDATSQSRVQAGSRLNFPASNAVSSNVTSFNKRKSSDEGARLKNQAGHNRYASHGAANHSINTSFLENTA